MKAMLCAPHRRRASSILFIRLFLVPIRIQILASRKVLPFFISFMLMSVSAEYGKTEKFIKENFKGTHTFLHSNWWLDSFYDLAIASSVKTGTFYSAAGKGRCAFVTRGDYADGAAAVLVSEAYKNEVIDFSGPEALSYPDVFERVKEATGIAVNVVDVPAATKADGIAKATNLPQFVVDALVGFDTGISNGLFDVAPSQGAEYIGHKPDSVIDFLNKGGRVEALKAAAGKA